jgi:hypothetical protein
MTDNELIMEMFNLMSDDFKKKHEIQVKDMLKTYSCICLMKEDLIGYAENDYKTDADVKAKLVKYIENLSSGDLQNIANDFPNDSVMDSFWYFIEYKIDLIREKIIGL